MKKVLKFLACFVLLFSIFFVCACVKGPTDQPDDPNIGDNGGNGDVDDNGSNDDNGNTNVDQDNTIEYKVVCKGTSGKPLKDFVISFTKQGTDIRYTQSTDNKGVATFKVAPDTYTVRAVETPGWYLQKNVDKTDTKGTTIEFVAQSSIITDETPAANYQYRNGDPVYDFTVETIDGKTWNLKEKLEQYKLVVINFFFTTCTYCIQELPAMKQAYSQFKDEVCVLMIDDYANDNVDKVSSFVRTNGLNDFDVVFTSSYELARLFNVQGYPTTAFIDTYGTVDYIEEGGLPLVDDWLDFFNEYTNGNYVPSYKPSPDELIDDRIVPDTQMPSSAEISAVVNNTNSTMTFLPANSSTSETDKKYNWGWVIDGDCIKTANTEINNSYSMMYVTINLSEGDVFTFDALVSTETDCDYFYVISEGKTFVTLSGLNDQFETVYSFVAQYSGEYEFVFIYMKDTKAAKGDDVIKLKNFRIESPEAINSPLYMFRDAAYGPIHPVTGRYTYYTEYVYNEEDGYYHVGSANGPLLLANMISQTKFSNKSMDDYAKEGACKDSVRDYNKIISEYVSYADCSIEHGYTPITQELFVALQNSCNAIALSTAASAYDNQWLELCVYFDTYGGAEPLTDPIVGLAPFNCYEAHVGIENSCYYAMPIDPRGYLFKFVPEESGVYMVRGANGDRTYCYVVDEKMREIAGNDEELRYFYEPQGRLDGDFILYVRLEAGKTYYIRPYFWDYLKFAEITFNLEFKGADPYTTLTRCSSDWYTTSGDDLDSGDLISGNYVDAVLGEDGYYYVRQKDGSLGSPILVDFEYMTLVDLKDALVKKGFNFSLDMTNRPLYDNEGYKIDSQGNRVKDKDGNYILKDPNHVDRTDDVKRVLEEIKADGKYISDPKEAAYGCYYVNQELMQYLQLIVEKYSFAGVSDSWLKTCYYFKVY